MKTNFENYYISEMEYSRKDFLYAKQQYEIALAKFIKQEITGPDKFKEKIAYGELVERDFIEAASYQELSENYRILEAVIEQHIDLIIDEMIPDIEVVEIEGADNE
jgi:hypothetical protein